MTGNVFSIAFPISVMEKWMEFLKMPSCLIWNDSFDFCKKSAMMRYTLHNYYSIILKWWHFYSSLQRTCICNGFDFVTTISPCWQQQMSISCSVWTTAWQNAFLTSQQCYNTEMVLAFLFFIVRPEHVSLWSVVTHRWNAGLAIVRPRVRIHFATVCFDVWALSFSPRRPCSLSRIMSTWLETVVEISVNSLQRAIAAWLECFSEKSSWCRNEQACQGVKCSALSGPMDCIHELYKTYLYLFSTIVCFL